MSERYIQFGAESQVGWRKPGGHRSTVKAAGKGYAKPGGGYHNNPHGLSKAEEKKVRSEIQQGLVGAFMRVLKQATPAQLEAKKIGWGSRLLNGYKARPDAVGFQAVKREYFGGHSASTKARSWLNSVNDSRWDTIIRAAAKEAIARHGARTVGPEDTGEEQS